MHEDSAIDFFEDLPDEVPVFPLDSVLLLPWATLPLNIFEPRYLAMVDDALGAGRVLAIVQPMGPETPDGTLYSVGCIGRIVSFLETSPERYEISLTGLSRFRLTEERACDRGYRRFAANYQDFAGDLTPPPRQLLDRPDDFFDILETYSESVGFPFDGDILRSIPHGNLVNALSMACPFDPREKQALLEAETPKARARLLHNLLQISRGSPLSSGSTQ